MIIAAMALCGVGIGLLVAAWLDRDRKPPIPKAGTLLIGDDGFYLPGPESWAGVSIAGDAVLMVSKNQRFKDGEPLTKWVRCEIVRDRPVIEGARPHKPGTQVYIRAVDLHQWRSPTAQETMILMQQLHTQETA